jgi:hypothetical protein
MKWAKMKMGRKTRSIQMLPMRSSMVLPENHQNMTVMKMPMYVTKRKVSCRFRGIP